jgi:hypothetical protein
MPEGFHTMDTPLEAEVPDRKEESGLDRRSFLTRLTGAAAAAAAPAIALAVATVPAPPRGSGSPASDAALRAENAYRVRLDAARMARARPPAQQRSNGDEERYPNRIESFSKGLPHDDLGEVDPHAYETLLRAIRSRDPVDFERIILGQGRKLTSPQSGLGFDLEGADSHQMALPPAPRFDSAQIAGEACELYWMALLRDVSFTDYGSDPHVAEAAAELSTMSDFRGPRVGAKVTPATLFRGFTAGDLIGPWMSQFLLQDIAMGALHIPQRMETVLPGYDYLTSYSEWLAFQRGFLAGSGGLFDDTPRYIRNLRDLARWVHVDALYQAYLHATLILMSMNAPLSPGLPPVTSVTQAGFVDFGGPHILSMMTEVATRALKCVWYQKWFVHRHLRPEQLGGRIHNQKTARTSYPLHRDILNSAAVAYTRELHGTYLLPMAFPEGCPTHPSYGAGHATVAGACTTMVKAFFDESFVLRSPVVPNDDGTALVPYEGPDLTVGNELNKVAANVGLGRNGAGVHWRSDYQESLKLGEALAISVLEEQKACYNETFEWRFTKLDGTRVVI